MSQSRWYEPQELKECVVKLVGELPDIMKLLVARRVDGKNIIAYVPEAHILLAPDEHFDMICEVVRSEGTTRELPQ